MIIVGDFSTPGHVNPDRKVNKETQAFLRSDGLDIYKAFHPKAAEDTFFLCAHGTFSRIDHMLGHKVSLNTFKKTETMSVLFSDHSTLRLDVAYKKKLKMQTVGLSGG